MSSLSCRWCNLVDEINRKDVDKSLEETEGDDISHWKVSNITIPGSLAGKYKVSYKVH